MRRLAAGAGYRGVARIDPAWTLREDWQSRRVVKASLPEPMQLYPVDPSSASDLDSILRSLEPVLHEGVFVYSSVPIGTDLSGIEVVGTFRETEGITLIVREEEARRSGLPILFRAAWITLTVQSDLEAVGLTATVATAVGAAGISCNVVAGAYHDHLFVPVERAEEAMGVLRTLQAEGGPGVAARDG